MNKGLLLSSVIWWVCLLQLQAQPDPCGPNPAMTSTCATACVVCDIDGFTGINDLTASGQFFPEFCTYSYDNIQYIAFIAGSVNLTIRVDVGNCTGGNNNLEVGFFDSPDCQSFSPITDCDTEIPEFSSETFTNTVPLTIGQHYYLVIDGSNGANCEWTFNVLAGTTQVPPLNTSGVISHSGITCPGQAATFSTTGEDGAAAYIWTIDGIQQPGISQQTAFTFAADGFYEICVTASNACDDAPPTCITYEVRSPGTLVIDELLCEGECVEANGVQYCETGSFQELVPLSNGCDSVILIDIEVFEVPTTMLDVWICSDEEFFVDGVAYNTTGSYSQTVLTDNDCDSIVLLELLVIECEIEGTSDEIPVVCNGTPTGTLIFSVNQGEAPLTYTYTNIANTAITGMGMTNLLTNNEINGIPAGIYRIYISDNFGNDVVVLQEVTEPPVLTLGFVPSDYNGFNLSCFSSNGQPGDDGELAPILTGGVLPYAYEWSNGATSESLNGLTAQQYKLTVTDFAGCTISDSFTLSAPLPIVPQVDFLDPTCDGFDTGEIAVLSVNGGNAPYTYSLNNQIYQETPLFTGLLGGDHSVYIKDQNECVAIVSSTLVTPEIPVVLSIEDLTINLGESTSIDPILNLNDFASITWSDSSSLNCGNCLNPIASPVNDTEYLFTVISNDGCSTSDSVNITVNKIRRVYIPNAFSPNADGINDFFTIYSGNEVAEISSFRLFNRWGAVLLERTNFPPNDPNFGWDGTFKGQELEPGIFVWTARIAFIDGVVIDYSGDIAIIK